MKEEKTIKIDQAELSKMKNNCEKSNGQAKQEVRQQINDLKDVFEEVTCNAPQRHKIRFFCKSS